MRLIIVISLCFISCSPFISKELRHKNKCNNKIEKENKRHKRNIEKIKSICPDASFVDTIRIPFEVKVPELTIKDSIQFIIDSSKVDSLLNEIELIEDRKGKIEFITTFINKSFELDTIIDDSIYLMRLEIKKGLLKVNVSIKERTIKGEAKTEVEQLKEIELK